MKLKQIIVPAIALALVTGFTATAVADEKADQAKLVTQAKVSKADAQQTALAKVPNGTVKEGEIEMEKGKLIWSFDISTPDSKNITEVNVDAKTGSIVNIETETPSSKEKEADEDKEKGEKGEKGDKD